MMEIYHTLTWIFGTLLLDAKVSPERSHQLIGSEFVTEIVHNYLQCQSLCDRRSLCKSVKYNTRTRECTSNYRDVKSSNMPLAPVESWVIFEDKSAKQVGRVCRSKPCAGNQVCVQLGSKGNCLTEDINCGETPVVPNAITSKNGTKFNSVANYSCDVGYVMSNGTMMSSTCESTGKWTSVNMTCTEIDCGEPPNVLHASVTSIGTTFNSVANYSCDVGYAMINGTTLTCGTDGRWTSTNFRCVVDCGTPGLIANGRIVCEATTVGSTGHVKCMELFKFFGNDSSTKCDSTGQWLISSGDCLQVEWRNKMTPFDINLPDTLTDGWRMVLHGTPIDPNRHFSVNLRDHADRYHMHMDVKFNYSGTREVVFDTCLNTTWGTTVVRAHGFPFRENVPFELILEIQAHKVLIIVDDKPFINVTLISPAEDITRVYIMEDVTLHQLMLIYDKT